MKIKINIIKIKVKKLKNKFNKKIDRLGFIHKMNFIAKDISFSIIFINYCFVIIIIVKLSLNINFPRNESYSKLDKFAFNWRRSS